MIKIPLISYTKFNFKILKKKKFYIKNDLFIYHFFKF